MRRATFTPAESFHAYVVGTYQRLRYQIIDLQKVSAQERASSIVSCIEDRV